MEKERLKVIIADYLNVSIESLNESENIYDLLNKSKLPNYGSLEEDIRGNQDANVLDLIKMILYIEKTVEVIVDDCDEYETLGDSITLIVNKNKK